ncbi:hypothetical protein [Mycoavidus sp. B2-EB]|uniref:hypothetical protein n=1 Tax=Mycoavidus sp. B2-EB TaxID=2651972 RepID=UPI0016275729|nr:hypothetical protein [Mycoavidus sp. B2-EB]BBO59095.1 hypothetical protein MPB2EB_0196 [Mycoavidus sp. B2-EB]
MRNSFSCEEIRLIPSAAVSDEPHFQESKVGFRSKFFSLGNLAGFRNKIGRGSQESPQIIKKPDAQKRYVLSTEEDFTIRCNARAQAIDHQIPKENCFYFDRFIMINPSHVRAINKSGILYKNEFGTPIFPEEGWLQKVKLADRLDIHGHGNEESFSDMSAEELAYALKSAGLNEVGILKLQSCNVGKGDEESFLYELKGALDGQGVNFGYICGPTGSLTDWRVAVETSKLNIRMPPFVLKKTVNFFMPAIFGLQVVKGNLDIVFPGTRYDLPIQK